MIVLLVFLFCSFLVKGVDGFTCPVFWCLRMPLYHMGLGNYQLLSLGRSVLMLVWPKLLSCIRPVLYS